jgi:hypothetical protein
VKRPILGAILVLLVLVGITRPFAQGRLTDVAIAISQLTTGVTPFTNEGVATNGYINFNTGRAATGYGFRDNNGVLQVRTSIADSWNNVPSGGAIVWGSNNE